MFRIAAIVLSLVGFLCACGTGGAEKPHFSEKKQTIPLAVEAKLLVETEGFGSSTINVSKFRSDAVISLDNGIQITAYFNRDGQACLAVIEDGQIHKITIQDEMERRLLGDGHCSINIGCWSDRVWYVYGAHANCGYYGWIDAEDLFSVSQISSQKLNVPLSYPSFYPFANRFLFVYRDGTNGLWSYLDLTQEPVLDFSKAQPLCEGNFGLYINDIGVSPNGMYAAIPFVERQPAQDDYLVRNDGVYLFWSTDQMETWESTIKSGLSLPVHIQDTEKVCAVGLEEALMNQESTCVTDEGEVWFTRITDDENGVPQVYLTGFNLKSYESVSYQVSENIQIFDLVGKGTLSLPISRAQVIFSEEFIHVIYRESDRIIVASAKKQGNMRLGQFERLVAAEDEVGLWEPNYDHALWEKQGILCLFVQETSQEDSDQPAEKEMVTPIYLIYLKESA